MRCSKCGADNKDVAKYCIGCGLPFWQPIEDRLVKTALLVFAFLLVTVGIQSYLQTYLSSKMFLQVNNLLKVIVVVFVAVIGAFPLKTAMALSHFRKGFD